MLKNEPNEEKTRNTGKNSAEAECSAMNAAPIGISTDADDSEFDSASPMRI